MSDQGNKNIKTGNISGTGIAVGHGARASVTITQQTRNTIINLIEQLHKDIENADIPESTKKVLINKAIPEMTQAMSSGDPKSGLQRGLERINDHLESAGVTVNKVSGIIETVNKIAKSAGLVIKTVAPFLAALL